MYGIPTRSDVADGAYREACERHEIAERLSDSRYPASIIPVNNHVAAALRAADAVRDRGEPVRAADDPRNRARELLGLEPEVALKPEDVYTDGAAVPEAVAERLDPDAIIGEYVEDLAAFRDEVEAVMDGPHADLLDRTHTNRTTRDYDLDPYTDEPLDRQVSRDVVDVREIEEYAGKSNGHDQYYIREYEWHQYELLTHEMDAFAEQLAAIPDSAPPGDRIHALGRVVARFEDSANLELLEQTMGSFVSRDYTRPRSLEEDHAEEIEQLKEWHAEIAADSDIALRFDELYFSADPAQLPADPVLTTSPSGDKLAMQQRQSFRDSLDAMVAERGAVTINGTTYTPRDGYVVADGPVHQPFVNMFAVPVEDPTGTRVRPDEWAVEERALVERYRDRDRAALEEILDRFDGFGDEASSFRDTLRQVHHAVHNYPRSGL